jgi:hypothetical protein
MMRYVVPVSVYILGVSVVILSSIKLLKNISDPPANNAKKVTLPHTGVWKRRPPFQILRLLF